MMDFIDRHYSFFVVFMLTVADGAIEDIERHLEMGKQFLAKGQFADALTHYHAAVDLDPNNYQTLYRRATVYLATGKSRSALPDLDRVIQLKPDFASARLQRGGVLMKQGNLEAAYVDYENVLAKEPENSEAQQKLQLIEPIKLSLQTANQFYDGHDFVAAEKYFSEVVDTCPWDIQLRERRAYCYELMGEIQKAIADIRATTKLVSDSTEAFLKLSQLYFHTGDTEESLTQVRECLKLNPDHKECFPFYKNVKKIFKAQESLKQLVQEEHWDDCIAKAAKLRAMIPADNPGINHDLNVQLCRCQSKVGDPEEAIKTCDAALEVQPRDIPVICDKAEAYLSNEQYDEAIRVFESALEIDENSRRASEGANRAKKFLKQSKKRDYYKILGVRRNANKKTIIRAYRKLAQKWHPDGYDSDEEKKKAEAKFIDIAAAKEVLTDAEKRQKFDAGEDPLDPEQNTGQGGFQHPFFHGFNPFGGGGGFKFTFN